MTSPRDSTKRSAFNSLRSRTIKDYEFDSHVEKKRVVEIEKRGEREGERERERKRREEEQKERDPRQGKTQPASGRNIRGNEVEEEEEEEEGGAEAAKERSLARRTLAIHCALPRSSSSYQSSPVFYARVVVLSRTNLVLDSSAL